MTDRGIVRLPSRNGHVAPAMSNGSRRFGVKALVATLCILVTSCGSGVSEQTNCSAYWLKAWNSRSDPQQWPYVDLAYYAGLGAHPSIPGYSSGEIAAYFSALAISNNQGLDLLRLTLSSKDMQKFRRAVAMRDNLSRFYGVPIPQSAGAPRDKCIYTEASATCLAGLTRALLPKAEAMQHYLEAAIRSKRLGNVPCKGSIRSFGKPELY